MYISLLILISLKCADSQEPPPDNLKCTVNIPEHMLHQIKVQNFDDQQQDDTDLLANWMDKLPDDVLVSELSIPGTHDTGAFRCDYSMPCNIFQCQTMSILQQLTNGIRYLDLRINSQQPLTIGHQAITFMTFQEALRDIAVFLRENPSQFIILAFQRNQGTYDPSCQIMKQLQRHRIAAVYRNVPRIPTIGELRGRVWVFSGLGINFKPQTFLLEGVLGITDHESIYLQNYWQIAPDTIAFKTEMSLSTAFKVLCKKTRIKANFLSGSVGITPLDLVNAPEGPNNQLERALVHLKRKTCLGITIMDYPKVSLIKQIVESNFDRTANL